jgi:hypothetical protein
LVWSIYHCNATSILPGYGADRSLVKYGAEVRLSALRPLLQGRRKCRIRVVAPGGWALPIDRIHLMPPTSSGRWIDEIFTGDDRVSISNFRPAGTVS